MELGQQSTHSANLGGTYAVASRSKVKPLGLPAEPAGLPTHELRRIVSDSAARGILSALCQNVGSYLQLPTKWHSALKTLSHPLIQMSPKTFWKSGCARMSSANFAISGSSRSIFIIGMWP